MLNLKYKAVITNIGYVAIAKTYIWILFKKNKAKPAKEPIPFCSHRFADVQYPRGWVHTGNTFTSIVNLVSNSCNKDVV